MSTLTSYRTNNDIAIPSLGLGVYLSNAADAVRSVKFALEVGYRLIDTASIYGNEAEVGEGIRQSGIKREDVFITSKVWLDEYGSEKTPKAFENTLKKLGTDYLDLYLLHWPAPSSFHTTVEAYKTIESLHKKGMIRAIGVCNFTPDLLTQLMNETTIIPAINQIELHPYFSQMGSAEFHRQHGIITQCWSPLGGIYTNHPADTNTVIHLLADPLLEELSRFYEKSPAQIVLRWHLHHGHAVIPKSIHKDRILENKAIFDFSLSTEDILRTPGVRIVVV